MSRFLCRVIAPIVVVLGATGSADAWYLGKWGVLPLFPGYHYRIAYWQGYAAPVSYPVYWVGYAPCQPVMMSAAPRAVWATPTPAPPSTTSPSTSEPPLQKPEKKAPTISESRSHGGNYTVSTANMNDVCRVGFWNLSGKDVTIQIGTLVHTVPKDRAVTFEVPRRFSYQMDQQQAQAVEVPGGGTTHEIVIRQ